MVQSLEPQRASPSPAPRAKAPRKKVPPAVAWVDADRCSGCEVCIAFCPVDCIALITDTETPTINPTCVVIEEDCIGCKICAAECPWDAIQMIPYRPAASTPSPPAEGAP
jgi:Pyruvate/2-oxoacid:ferredoxin oxidoreductase delta subunit